MPTGGKPAKGSSAADVATTMPTKTASAPVHMRAIILDRVSDGEAVRLEDAHDGGDPGQDDGGRGGGRPRPRARRPPRREVPDRPPARPGWDGRRLPGDAPRHDAH